MLQLIKALPADKRYQTIRNMDEKLQQHEKVKKEKNSAFIDTVFKIIEVLPILDSVKRNGKELLSKAREFISDAEEWVAEAWQWFKDLVKKF